MMTTTVLKPCPDCKGKAVYKSEQCAEDAVAFWCECRKCGKATDVCEDAYEDYEQVAYMWNQLTGKEIVNG